jgi:superfamily II DNA or RNA helicase
MKTLKDKLAHLTFRGACKLLGPEGEKLIRRGGQHEIDIALQVTLRDDVFRLLIGKSVVEVTPAADARQALRIRCTTCGSPCEHQGAALSVILEDKLALGLSAPPAERTPVESLSGEELVKQAIAERLERAHTEKMELNSLDPNTLWTDYTVTSKVSGRTYRVALRGWERGDCYCSCPDFRKNTLGTCKHILHALEQVKTHFSETQRRTPYQPTNVFVHLHYGEDLELRLVAPPGLNGEASDLLDPIAGRHVADLHDLLQRVARTEQLGHDVTIYPDAEEFINRGLFQERIQRTVADIRRDPTHHPLRTGLLKTPLLPYQLDGIAFVAGLGRAILADDMGLGKTIQGVGVAELLAKEASITRVLVVCPTSLKSQWRLEIERFTERSCRLVLGNAAERSTQYGEGTAFFTICNYEQVLRDIDAIEATRWDLIILDEGQRIKNWEAKTSRTIKGLKSRFALVLSGTPLENRLDELYSVVEFIDNRRLGPAFQFFNTYRVVDEKGRVLGYKNLDDLRARLKPILLRRTRKDVVQDLPPRTTVIRRIPPTDEQLAAHDSQYQVVRKIVNKPYISEIDLLRLQKALLMCRMAANSTFLVDKTPPGYSSKLEELDSLLDQLSAEEDRKIILFSEWTTMLNLVEPLLNKRRLPFVRLDGSIPQTKRQVLIHQFQNDPGIKLFITTNAGATGLNLQAANTIINVDLPWNPAVLEQRIARAHRMGQKRPVQAYLLVTESTLEENLLVTLSAKQELALAALDPTSDVTQIDLVSGIEELKRRLEVLLGAKPEAAIDESRKAQVEREAQELARKERVAVAGGQLLGAAFAFMGEMFAGQEETVKTREMAQVLKQQLAQCMEPDTDGRLKMSRTLPDDSALDTLARSLAQIIGGRLA